MTLIPDPTGLVSALGLWLYLFLVLFCSWIISTSVHDPGIGTGKVCVHYSVLCVLADIYLLLLRFAV
jgi:hypothetical protein